MAYIVVMYNTGKDICIFIYIRGSGEENGQGMAPLSSGGAKPPH